MCGKESSGLSVADPALYRDKVFVLTPLPRMSEWALGLAQELTQAIGAKPLILDADRHDRLVAAISHLPYALAVTLVNAVEALGQDDPLVWRLAAGGFRDTSRIAGGSIPMMLDIMSTNREHVLETLHEAAAQLSSLIRYLEDDDMVGLRDALIAARDRRAGLFPGA